ncbi:lebercilin-like protein isoform X1 [Alosa sapidissima]|uniref:lebercilin-like protein isoform X1 n=1 Tax=Alosa sapidissima TaxID=34773 RepID=UPI001C0827F2|nr:lebercilin-like protein isoform X1 [Alosa sapidissima]
MSFQHFDNADYEGGQGDALSCSRSASNSSSESTTSNKSKDRAYSSRGRSPASYSQDDFEDDKDTFSVLEKSHASPVKKSLKKAKHFNLKGQKRLGVQHPHQKKSHRPGRKAPLFPPIRPLDAVGQRVASAREHRIKELSSQVWELQRQLDGAWQENRLMRRVQNRHTAALQHFQDSQSGLPQILLKHGNEVHALQELLRKARGQRNSMAQRLASMEDHLRQASEERRRLQLLCRQRHLGKREELTQQLSKLSLEMEVKTMRIKELERNLELSNACSSRHLSTEMRKTVEARDLSKLLQEQIDQLTQKIRERERELENHNIYSHRFPKAKKGTKETKGIQTEGFSPLPLEAPSCKLEIEYESEEHLEKQRSNRSMDLCAIDFSELQKDQNDTDRSLAEDSESKEGPAIAIATEGTEAGMNEEEQQYDSDDDYDNDEDDDGEINDMSGRPRDATHDPSSPGQADTSLDLDDMLGTSCPSANKQTTPRARRHYTFKETIQNLHRGRPAYGLQKGSKGPASGPSLGGDSAPYEPSFLSGSAGRARPSLREDQRHEGEENPRSRKSSLMRELFGLADAAEPRAERKTHAKEPRPPPTVSSDSDRTSSYVLGDTVSHIRDRFIIFD